MIKISKRLCTVADYVRNGAVVADIGTDHAYLPIYLAQSNKIQRAVASDINVGPLDRAKINIEKNGLNNVIDTYLTNGLNGIEKFEPTDILICGMGGELIAKIIDESSYVKNNGVRLILQPMTSVRELREYLQRGFFAIAENIVFEDKKLYQIICVEYDGIDRKYSDIQLELGPKNIESNSDNFKMLVSATIKKREKKIDGLRLGGYDTDETEREIIELKKLLKGI